MLTPFLSFNQPYPSMMRRKMTESMRAAEGSKRQFPWEILGF